MMQSAPTSLLGTLGFMGNPSNSIRSQAGGNLLNSSNSPSFSREVRPLAASNNGPVWQIGDPISSSVFEGANVETHTSAVFWRKNPDGFDVPKDEMKTTEIFAKTWGDPHYETDLIEKYTYDKDGKIIKTEIVTNRSQISDEHLKRLESLSADQQRSGLDVDGDNRIDFKVIDNNFTHKGMIGDSYRLFHGDNLNVSGLYGESPWNPDGPTVIVLTQIRTDAGYKILFDKTDPGHVRIDVKGDGNFKEFDLTSNFKMTLGDGTVVTAGKDDKGQQGIKVLSNLGNQVMVVNEWGNHAQTVYVDGVGTVSGRDVKADHANKLGGTAFYNVTDEGLLGWMAKNNRYNAVDVENKDSRGIPVSLARDENMEKFAEREFKASGDVNFWDIPTRLYKGKVWVTKTPPPGARR